MTIEHSNRETPLLDRLLRESHRSLPEQLVGGAIFFLLSLLFISLLSLSAHLHSPWLSSLHLPYWSLPTPLYPLFWALYTLQLSAAMWSLWRLYSLTTLKLELSLYLSQYLLQLLWGLSFFTLHQTLLSLVLLLILWCNHLLTSLLFWKKNPLSGQLGIAPSLWIFYLLLLTMATSLLNP